MTSVVRKRFINTSPDSKQKLTHTSPQEYKEIEQEFPAEVVNEQRRRKLEGKARASHAAITYDMTRGSEQEIALAVKSVTRNLSLLADSKSFMLAMSHVGSLRQKAEYDNDVAPNTVAD